MSDDILKLSNICYYNKKFYIEKVDNNINLSKFIDNRTQIRCDSGGKKVTVENLLVVNTLHSCFSHALIDCVFPYFWVLRDIKDKYNINDNFTVFIREKKVLQYEENLALINSKNSRYKSVWNDLMCLISDKVIFEHNISKDTVLMIKNCFFYIIDDKWQRSPWNCIDYYPERKVEKHAVIYDDSKIYTELRYFVEYVKNTYNISNNATIDGFKAIIIERKKNRFWNPGYLNKIVKRVSDNSLIKFNGVHILEELPFSEQIKLFTNNNVFIFRHGSCLIHLLWIPQNSVIFDIDTSDNRKNIVRRIAKLTDSKVISLSYDNIDYSKFDKF